MKLTAELLESLGFQQQKNKNDILIDIWYLKMHGYLFIIKGGPDNWRFYSPGSLEPYYHCVTDLEEIFGFTFKDAFESGKNEAKRELREWLKGEDD